MAFPNPPNFAKLYTARAVAKKRCPAPPPIPRQFVVFGEPYNFDEPIIPSLKSLGQNQLYIQPKTMSAFKIELKRLNASIIALFLDLIEIQIISSKPECVNEIFCNLRVVFINIHHLINECRKAQGYAAVVATQNERNMSIQGISKKFETVLSTSVVKLKRSFVKTIDDDDNDELMDGATALYKHFRRNKYSFPMRH